MPEPTEAQGILGTVKAGEQADLTRQLWGEAYPATIFSGTYERNQHHTGNAAREASR